MSIVQAVRDFLTRKVSVPAPAQAAKESVSTLDAYWTSPEGIVRQYLALVKDDLAQAEADSLRLSAQYGDFAAFFYRADFDLFLRQEWGGLVTLDSLGR